MSNSTPIGLAVIGYGYWGPNLVRNAIESPDLDLQLVCDGRRDRLAAVEARHPRVRTCAALDEALRDPLVHAVALATPPSTHYALARQALEMRKHVLVEKPLAMTARHAEDLISLAAELDLVLMPAHTFLYSPPVNKVKELIEAGELGEVYFVTSSRMNLGIWQPDGVMWDLAPHDLSILSYWLPHPLAHVAATGQSAFRNGVTETAFLSLGFEDGARANVQLSWLAPRKTRQMVVVGSKRMVVYEDTAADEVVRVYDRGVELAEPANFGEYKLTYRSGDMVAPRIDAVEPLALELRDFARSIRTGETPVSSARVGLEIVRAIEAAQASLDAGGIPVALSRPVAPPDRLEEDFAAPPRDPADVYANDSAPEAGRGAGLATADAPARVRRFAPPPRYDDRGKARVAPAGGERAG